MKILHTVQQYSPSIGGMQEVVKQLSEELVRRGHDVTVATSVHSQRGSDSIHGVKIQGFDISGNFVNGLKGNIQEYQDFILQSDFDIVTNFASQQWATDAVLPILKRIQSKKVFVPTGFSALYEPKYASYFSRMGEWMNEYDINIFLSHIYRDIQFAIEHGIKKRKVIPNGASEKEFSKEITIDIRELLNIPTDQMLILHVGSHTGDKGHKESIQLFQKADIKNACLLLVGNNPGRGCYLYCKLHEFISSFQDVKKKKNIQVKNLSREYTVAAYHAADVFLFPSNIECSPIVLFESMASKTPFLTSEVGNAKEIIEWSNGGLLLPTHVSSKGYARIDIQRSVPLFEKIINDVSLQKKLGHAGYNSWKKEFTWEKITVEYEKIYKELLHTS